MLVQEQMLGPREVTLDNVQYWSRHAKALENSQVSKALRFLKFDCIKYIGYDSEFGSKHCFICLPLNKEELWTVDGRSFQKIPYSKNYNSSEYKIYKNMNGDFECNCQGCQTKIKKGEFYEDGCNCAHILSLFFAFKVKKFGKPEGAEEKHIEIDME